MTHLTSPAAEVCGGVPNAMADIIDSLKRLERIGAESSKTVEKILQAARDLEEKIASQYACSERASINGGEIIARIAAARKCSLSAAARSIGVGDRALQMKYTVETSIGHGPSLLGRTQKSVSDNREAALSFANDVAHGFLNLVEQDVAQRHLNDVAAIEALGRAGEKTCQPPVTLRPGEAAIVIVRRSETQPPKYFFAVRRAGSCFDQATHDFQLQGLQEAISELGERSDFDAALDEALTQMKRLRP